MKGPKSRIKVGVAGAAGKIGRALVRAVCEHEALTLAAAWEAPGNALLGQDAGQVAGAGDTGIPLTDQAEAGLLASDVVIDFTNPQNTVFLATAARKTGRNLVIGTTGLTAEQLYAVKQAAKKTALVYATNFSTGVNVLWFLARQTAAVLGEAYDAEIVESHHNQKKDAPSGTALTLLEEICTGKGLDPKQSVRHGRLGLTGARTREEVGIHAVRAGDIVGEHVALFAGPGERLELKHQAHSRDIFARGAVRAAAWIKGKKPGFYRMSDVLGLK
ncbi:4-hydroxy-tetrahydrodipicolinate reductase [candidate division FCPU426 bacterium]|nr:4-hydroxy-tetrahydrodipicolinate reductase [candidate division FCPU426 bacterium]